jgi:hypothetical protein
MTIPGILFVLFGIYLIVGVAFNLNIFMNKENRAFPLGFLPRQLARIIMCIWGLASLAVGIVFILGKN